MLEVWQDLLSSSLLLPALDRCLLEASHHLLRLADPDFINQKIVRHFRREEGEEGVREGRGERRSPAGVSSPRLAMVRLSLVEEELEAGGSSAEEQVRLEGERRELVAHLERTEAWAAGLGRWRAGVRGLEGGREAAVTVAVHLPGEEEEAWVVVRSLPELRALRQRLAPYFPWVRALPLPPPSRCQS